MRAGADAEEDVGPRQPELVEEHVGHLRVVVLPGVHEQPLHPGIELAQGTVDGRRLHEVRAGTDDEADAGRHGRIVCAVDVLGIAPQQSHTRGR